MRILFILLICLSSCKVLTSQKSKEISFELFVHKPYCGGARPTAELGKGYDEPLSNKRYFIYEGDKLTESSKKIGVLQLDSNGSGKFALQPGNYFLLDADKTLPLKEFIALKTSLFKENYEIASTDCFEKWQHEPDVLLTIEAVTSSVTYVFPSQCWVGMTNCVKYIGPPAP